MLASMAMVFWYWPCFSIVETVQIQLHLKGTSGLAKFDWKVVAQWATKDSILVAQQWLVVARQCKARNGGIWWHLEGKL